MSCSLGTMAPSDGASTAPNSFSQATFQGDVPRWGEAATTVMRELEQWRGHNFIEDLQVTFLPQEDPDLNGWYNSATKELVVTTGASEQMGRGVLLHEIFHALQDQHFNLSQLHIDSQDEPDYDKAVTAIIEGEAMLAVSELLNYNFLDHARLPANGPIPEEFFEKVFLYGAGLKFIEAVRAAGGWEAVDAAFQDPPQATALIFQPKRYLAGERTTPMLAVPVKDGETLQKKMIRGEYEIRLLLVQAPQLRPELDKISKDYVTDTLGILEKLDHTSVHRWLIEFTTAEAATRWQAPFTKALTDNRQTEMAPLISVNGSTLTAEW